MSSDAKYRERIQGLLDELNEGLYERESIMASTLLTVLSGQSVFLYGPPGTAKSLVARRISSVFENSSYFEYLMQRFSTPEDVFGPISISELKKDNYVRKTENYLPTADFAFLDEIWKSSPAILNTLLTIINEKRFKNGNEMVQVPLKALISASNEFPQPNSGLDALYDRFITRIVVNPMEDVENFHKMISTNDVKSFIQPSKPITIAEWKDISSRSASILISEESFAAIDYIKRAIYEFNLKREMPPIYVSDRRWQKAMVLLKTSALLNDRTDVSLNDVLILSDCLWSSEEDSEVILKIVCDSYLISMLDKVDIDKWISDYQEALQDIESYKDERVANLKDKLSKNKDYIEIGGNSGFFKSTFNNNRTNITAKDAGDHLELIITDSNGSCQSIDIGYDTLVKKNEQQLEFNGYSFSIRKYSDGTIHINCNNLYDELRFILPKEYIDFDFPPTYKKNLLNLKDRLDSVVDSITGSVEKISFDDQMFISSRCQGGIQDSLISLIESLEAYSEEITKLCNSM